MSFDGDEYVGLDSDAVAANEFLDAFAEQALNANVEALWSIGDRCSWTPRCADADDMSASEGHRPYASAAWSSVLNVPWIAPAGTSSLEVHLFARQSNEHGQSGEVSRVRVSLVGVGEELDAFAQSDTSTPEFQEDTYTLDFDPLESALVTDLRVEHMSAAINHTVDSDSNTYFFTRSSVFTSTATGVFATQSSSPPDSTDQHLMCFEDQKNGPIFDLLHTVTEDYAYIRSVTGEYADRSNDTRLAPLSYLQVRGVEVVQKGDGSAIIHPRERFRPWDTVDSRDVTSHALDLSAYYQRPRPLWIGPVGTLGDTEHYPDGYGRRFDVLDGATTSQDFITALVRPRTDAPRLRMMANLMPLWLDSGIQFGAVDAEGLEALQGLADWDFTLTAYRWQAGGITTLATGTIPTATLAHYPAILTGANSVATGEFIHLGLGNTGSADRYYKEGQLFAEDYQWLQRVAIDVDLTSYDAATDGDEPIILVLSCTASVDADDFPPPLEIGGGVEITETALRLVNTGASVWELPQI